MAELRVALLDFLEIGGPTMWPLFGVCLLMWTLIFERLAYFAFFHRRAVARCHARWQGRAERRSWHAERIRELWISRLSLEAGQGVGLIGTLVSICPLFGLLGTVLGMLDVFHVIAVAGGGNIRAMAAGISAAIVSTMAGLVAALSGLPFSVRLKRKAGKVRRQLADLLVTEETGA
ncbi:MAG: MotA/TolQ/ExbB proton channel family protein [Myxococcota bacterium]|jgi:biopolymer transport protein ExbB|nr:MotA/TolQ/ExbB proton channel family protein [Myxococcota bacterium]